MNFQILMEREISSLNSNNSRPRLLLHSCCAPCSSAVLERLSEHFEITIFFYNPNIFPFNEYKKRLDEQKKLSDILNGITCVEAQYNHDDFLKVIKGLENEAEGKARCEKCFEMRLENSAVYAVKNGFEYLTTTLSVSPHKNSAILNTILTDKALMYGIKPLLADFKKKNGYKRSVELSVLYGIYRQNYCGCEFSVNKS